MSNIKQNNSKKFVSLILCIMILAVSLGSQGSVMAASNNNSVLNALAGKKVTLDPGHGWGGDPGSSGNGMYEKDVTLDLARRIKTILESQGVVVTLTRNGDEPGKTLSESAVRANQYAADIVVAIHTNGGVGATGTESCYTVNKSNSASSKVLGSYLTNSVSNQLGLVKRGDFQENDLGRCARRGTTGWTQLYIHNMNPVTALIETAFINGAAKDVDILKNKRQELAQAIASSIAGYFGSTIVKSCTVPTGQFCGEYYNNRTLSSPTFTQNIGSINFNWGNGGPGNGVGNDNFSARWQGIFPFESATYRFTATADDGVRLYVDNALQIDAWRDQGTTTYTKDVVLSAGNHTIKVEYYENGGGAVAQASWAKIAVSSANLARGKTASATSNQSSSYTPNLAVDGNTSTRWSSGQSSSLGSQWWIVDLGNAQSINQFVVRWEAAYARDYFVGYSNPPAGTSCWSTTYYGFNRYPTSAITDTISFSTVTARCVGVYMRQRASGMSNYSIYEVEVYRK